MQNNNQGPQEYGKPTYGTQNNTSNSSNQSYLNQQYQPIDSKGLGSRPNQYRNDLVPDFKERNRGMYASTMEFSSSGNSPSLETFGRFVNEDSGIARNANMGFGQSPQGNSSNFEFINKYANTNQQGSAGKPNLGGQNNNRNF